MNTFKTIAALGLWAVLGAGASTAFAQSTRTWVSGVGDDANPCSRTAPCKTFAGAISRTVAGGEINCIDAGGFGVLMITKAISIVCATGEAGVMANGTDGIIVNAGPNDAVVLSGLDFEGLNAGLNGINFQSGGSLTLINSSIRDFTQDGIRFAPNSNAALHVVNTKIGNSGQGGSYAGIYIQPSGSAGAVVTVAQSQVTDGTYGIVADGTATTGAMNGAIRDTDVSDNTQNGMIRDSDVSYNAQNGVTTNNGSATRSTWLLDHASVLDNGAGGIVATGSLAGMLVGNSTVFGNHAGLVMASGGVLVSYGNNRINGNYGADGSFSSTIQTK